MNNKYEIMGCIFYMEESLARATTLAQRLSKRCEQLKTAVRAHRNPFMENEVSVTYGFDLRGAVQEYQDALHRCIQLLEQSENDDPKEVEE